MKKTLVIIGFGAAVLAFATNARAAEIRLGPDLKNSPLL